MARFNTISGGKAKRGLLLLTLFGLLMITKVCGESFYELLGLNRDANEGDIKRAFRKLSL
jgi:hypothetical protein